MYTVCVYIHVQCTSNKIGGNYGMVQKKLHVGVCSCLKRRSYTHVCWHALLSVLPRIMAALVHVVTIHTRCVVMV